MNARTFLCGAALALGFTACIQDEALNVEAAIDACTGANIQLATIDHERKVVEVYVLDGTDTSRQELTFTLADNSSIAADSPEATDQPPLYDFSRQGIRQFTVTSEDGNTHTTYAVRINKLELPTRYSFEELQATTPYHVLYLTNASGIMQWASGNPGYKLSGMALDETEYPTVQLPIGKSGKGVRLTTRSTGSFGQPIGMPIAAGNLFIGSFDAVNAVIAPRQATLFGFPFTRKPVKMTGYYTYKAGSTFTDGSGNVVSGRTDKADIYAVLYEAESSDFSLDGDLFPNGTGLDEHIVLMARIDPNDMRETDDWTKFDLTFQPQNGKTIAPTKLEAGKYKLAVVFSSSIMGAYFEGAVGSELCIDEVEITCEN